MSAKPTAGALYESLRGSGLSRKAARRMAAEWLDHYDDVALSLQQSDDAKLILGTMGSVDDLTEAAQCCVSPSPINVAPEQVAAMQRWTGACTAGLFATLTLFALLGQLIS